MMSYFSVPVDEAVLQRYKLLHTGRLNDMPPNESLVAETAPPVDDRYDTFYQFRMTGTTSSGIPPANLAQEQLQEAGK